MNSSRLTALALSVVAAAIACGNSSSDPATPPATADASVADVVTTPVDAGDAATPPSDAGAAEAGAACNLAAPFATPVAVDGVNTPVVDWCPRLNDSTLELYLTREVPDAGFELLRYLRPSTAHGFSSPTVLSAMNSPEVDECAFVSNDGLQLFFDSRRTGNYDLYVATRPSLVTEFSNPTPLANVNTGEAEWWIWPSGDELFYTATRGSVTSIFRAVRPTGGSYGAGAQVAELHEAGSSELGASLTGDGLTVYFTRGGDLWTSQRASRGDPFQAPHKVAELNSDGADDMGWVSPNGCTVFFSSSRNDGGSWDIYTASKPPL